MILTQWIILLFFFATILPSQVIAGIIGSDNFDYADGSLVSNGYWETHSGRAGDLVVSGGTAIVQHGVPSEDTHIAFSSRPGNLYYGLDLSVTAESVITGSDSEYFAHFKDAGSNFAARLDVVPALGGGDFSLGIATDSSTADSTWATDLIFGTTYRAVVKYDQIINLALLWINATIATDEFIAGEIIASPADTISQFALRQSDSNLNETIKIDNLVIGTSFEDVARRFTMPIPEPSTLAMFMLGLIYFRYRSENPRSS
ncbi:MAG: PEP-CTERM sorting domain-containing protein [Halioglobus sp.]